MKLTTIEELRDKRLGTLGTPERDRFEEDLQAEINAYFIGEAIRKGAPSAKPYTRTIRRAYRSTEIANF